MPEIDLSKYSSNLDLLEDIVQETVNGDEVLDDAKMEKWAALTVNELNQHAWDYVDRWLDAYAKRDERLSVEALVGLYLSGFITGRLYEERRPK